MHYRATHRTGTGNIQGPAHATAARKTPSRTPEKSTGLFRKIGYLLLFLAGVGAAVLAVHLSAALPEPSQNDVVYTTFRGDVWAMLQTRGR